MINKFVDLMRNEGEGEPEPEFDIAAIKARVLAGETAKEIASVPQKMLDDLYAAAYAQYSRKNYTEALPCFLALVQLDSKIVSYLFGLAACLQMLERYEAALEIYGMIAMVDMQNGAVLLHIAECMIALGRTEEAQQMLKGVQEQSALPDAQKRQAKFMGLRLAKNDINNQ